MVLRLLFVTVLCPALLFLSVSFSFAGQARYKPALYNSPYSSSSYGGGAYGYPSSSSGGNYEKPTLYNSRSSGGSSSPLSLRQILEGRGNGRPADSYAGSGPSIRPYGVESDPDRIAIERIQKENEERDREWEERIAREDERIAKDRANGYKDWKKDKGAKYGISFDAPGVDIGEKMHNDTVREKHQVSGRTKAADMDSVKRVKKVINYYDINDRGVYSLLPPQRVFGTIE